MNKRRSKTKINRYWYISIMASFVFLIAMIALYADQLQHMKQLREDFRSTHTNLFIEKQ